MEFISSVLGNIILRTLKRYDWRQIAIVYSTETRWEETFTVIRDVIKQSNYTKLSPLIPFEAYSVLDDLVEILKKYSRSTYKVFLVIIVIIELNNIFFSIMNRKVEISLLHKLQIQIV